MYAYEYVRLAACNWLIDPFSSVFVCTVKENICAPIIVVVDVYL